MSGYIVHGRKYKSMEETIVKRWDTIRIIRAFKNEFQLFIMEANATTLLFNVTPDIEEHNEIKVETDATKVTLIIMEECLQQASAITTLVAIASYAPIDNTRG